MHFFYSPPPKKKEERTVCNEMYSVIAACLYLVVSLSVLVALLGLGWYAAWHLVLKRHRITRVVLREFCTSPEEAAAKEARRQMRARRREHRMQSNQLLSACTVPPSDGMGMGGSAVVGAAGRANISVSPVDGGTMS